MDSMISVIIPARDCEDVIEACLQSLSAQTLQPLEVIVVDDASTDRTRELVSERFPWVKLVARDERGGYSGACASGFEEAEGDWIAVLNADTEADKDWIKELDAASNLDESTGMIASLVLSPGNEKIDSAGLGMSKTGMAMLRGHGHTVESLGAAPRAEEVFGPAGSAAMYRRDMLDETGFFEPDYVIYYEDVDLAFRGRWMGWKCVLAKRARVVHAHSHTMKRHGDEKRRLLQRNRLRTMVRNWPASWLLFYMPGAIIFDLLSIAGAFYQGSFLAPLRARLDFLKKLRRDLRERRRIMETGKASPAAVKPWLGKDGGGAGRGLFRGLLEKKR